MIDFDKAKIDLLYLYAFKNIEFAVYCSPRDDRNFKVFKRVLKPYCS